MYRSLLALAFIPAAAAAQLPMPDTLRPISLQEAVSLAQRNAPSAVQARGQLRTTSSAVRSAYGAYLPSLSTSAGQSKQAAQRFDPISNTIVTSNSPWNYSAGLSASLELWDGMRRYNDL